MSPKLVQLLERRLSRLRDEHGRRLVFESDTALELVDPARPASVSNAYEELLRLTSTAVSDYCRQLRTEVETFTASTLPALIEADRDDVLRLTAKHADADLYLTRFDKFGEAVERRFGRTGQQLNVGALRLDLFRSRLHVGTLNEINRSLGVLRDDLDLRILADQAVQPTPPETPHPSTAMEHEQLPASSALRGNLLLDLFRQATAPKFVVDRRSFRVRHEEHIEVLDEMARSDDIRDNQGVYAPALLALSELTADPDVRQFLDDCDLVLRVLRDRYRANQVDMVEAEELARQAGLDRGRFDRAMTYLNESVSLLGGSRGSQDEGPLQMVVPGEKVLRLKSVQDVLDELRHYRSLRASWTGLPLESAAAAPRTPAHAVIEERQWLQHLPDDVRALLAETYAAQHIGLRALVVMGVRAAIDMTCNHLVSDLGSFDRKLDALRDAALITEAQRHALGAVVQVGHASAHRGHIPDVDDVNDVLDILERMLKAHYLDPRTAERLRQVTPTRRPSS